MSNEYHAKYNKKRPVIHFRVSPEIKKKLVKHAKLLKMNVANMLEYVIKNWFYED